MFNDAGIEAGFRKGSWAECAPTATYYVIIIVKKDKDKSPMELICKEKAKELKRLRKIGEICVAATKAKIQGKLSDRGTVPNREV
jgi:hypothetical protein